MPSPGKILMEADSEYGKHRILILKDGSLGFEREGYEYSFNYFLPVDKEVILNITSTRLKTTLVVDDRHYDAIGRYEFEDLERANNLEFSTLSLPIKRIGAKENGLDN